MSAVAAEMLARSVRASSGLGCASLFAPPRVAPLKRAARPLAASPEPPAPAAEELLQASAVEDGVRDFYRSVQSAKALPKAKTSLGRTMETLRRRFQGKHGYRKLHPKEVQLLALLHDAGLPVLGADALGKVVCVATTSKWRWEFAGALGDNCDTEAAALEELRSARSRLCPALSDMETHNPQFLSLKEAQRAENDERLARNPFPGFGNLGNTCYANAMLQCLFHCDCVRAQWRTTDDNDFALRRAVVALLEEYLSHRCDVILPYTFLVALQISMGHLGNVVSTQQDCQEVTSFLLAAHTSGLTLSYPHAACQDGSFT